MAYMAPSALDEIDTELEDQRRLSAIVISLQRQAQTQGPGSAPSVVNANATSVQAPQSLGPSIGPTALHRPPSSNRFHLILLSGMLLIALGVGWSAGWYFHKAPAPAQWASVNFWMRLGCFLPIDLIWSESAPKLKF